MSETSELGVNKPPVSVQVTATVVNGGGVEMCVLGDKDRTHISVYVRYSDGTVQWQSDFSVKHHNAYTAAVIYAAKLSMRYGIPIEPIVGDSDV